MYNISINKLGEKMERIKDEDINSEKIADFFLGKKELTPKRIQKLVYYAYAWFITMYNQDPDEIKEYLFSDEHPEAWLHGPVFRKLYKKYSDYGWHEVPKQNKIIFENDDVMSFMEDIWSKYGKLSADELEYLTHQEMPWKNARKKALETGKNQEINAKDIFVYYNSIQNLE